MNKLLLALLLIPGIAGASINRVENNLVTTAKLANGSVTTPKLHVEALNDKTKFLSVSGIIMNDDGLDFDMRVEGNTAPNMFFVDASLDTVSMTSGQTPGNVDFLIIKDRAGLEMLSVETASTGHGATGNITINEAGNDVNFKVEGDTEVNLLFVDASTDRVGIGTASPGRELDVQGIISSSGTATSLRPIYEMWARGTADAQRNWRMTADSNVNGTWELQYSNSPFGNPTANTAIAVDNSGNVGIGTASPDYKLTVTAGSGVDEVAVGGVLNTLYTDNTTPASTGEQIIATYTLPANSLSVTGRGIRISAWGSTTNNANVKTLKLDIGGLEFRAQALTTSTAANWKYEITIYRTGSNTQKYFDRVTHGTAIIQDGGSTQTVTDTTDSVINLIIDQGSASADAKFKGWTVEFI